MGVCRDWQPLDGYSAYHAPRFQHILDLLASYGAGLKSSILDIGPSQLTELVRQRFGVSVDTLGFAREKATSTGQHFEFDLNRAASEIDWRRDLPQYDFLILAEVLEHLHTAPELVLAFLKTLLRPGGYLLLQTPNAASIQKRLKLLLGFQPYERLRMDPTNPGHFREYTTSEVDAIARSAGFEIVDVNTAFYFDTKFVHDESGRQTRYRPFVGRLKNCVYRCLPAGLREGVTAVLKKPSISQG